MNTLQEINTAYDKLHKHNLFTAFSDQYPRLIITATTEFNTLSTKDKKHILRTLWQNTKYLGVFIHDEQRKLLASVNIRCFIIPVPCKEPVVYTNTYKKLYKPKTKLKL